MDASDIISPGGAGAARAKDRLSILESSEKLVVALLESASQAIVGADRTGKIVLANRRTEELFGYSREELLGNTIEMLLPASKRAAHVRERGEFFERPRVRHMGIGMELAGRRRDGSQFPVEVSLSYVETADGVFAMAFVTDITQRKQLEEQLGHAQKMEAVGRLAGGVAHDFNNMLTVIAGYNRMILDDASTTDLLRGYALETLKASDRAAALTSQLLAFSRRQVVRPRVMSVNTVMVNIEKMLRRLIGEDLELVLALDPEAGNIKADPSQIEQAVANLAINSRDAMPGGGRITIETGNVYLDDTYARTHLGVVPGEFVMLALSDTGHGMDAETKRRIFEPFFTTKEQGKGTGLGLATVYGMVKQAGGDIWVYSEPGQGTTFKLYFPRIAAPVSEAPGGEVLESKAVGAETILVEEDDEAVRDLTVKILRQLGYTVLTAAGGEEAVAVSRKHPGEIALMLTDVVMPGMSGRTLADVLSKTRPKMRVVYLSGYTENTILHHGVLDPGVDFIPKPYSRDVLARKLREVLTRKA